MSKFTRGLLCFQVTQALYFAATAASSRVVVDSRSQVPYGWTALGPAPADHIIRLSIALETTGQDRLDEELHQISNPDHVRYGQHLTRDEAWASILPRREAVDSTRRWLSLAQVPEGQIRQRGHFLEATVTVQDAEALLATNYSVFSRVDDDGGRRVIGTLAYSVPADVRRHIVAIQPTTFFDTTSYHWKPEHRNPSARAQARSTKNDTCDTLNTPLCLRELYGINDYRGRPHPRSLLGVVGFSKQAAQYDQLEKYVEKYATYAKGANFTVALINNGTNPQGLNYPSGEANLDIQIAVAMAHRVPVRFYSTGGEDHNFQPDLDISDRQKEHVEPWLQFVSFLLDLPDQDLPQVMSISYGVNEQAIPKPYAQRICHIFGQLSLRGMSVIVASGDAGPGISCQSNDGTKTNATRFLPDFPATCPYVTSVGGTGGKSPERALNFSSGGFSDYWYRPAWQDDAVKTYLSRHGKKWSQYYNQKGRGFPDVAAQGTGYPIFNHDKIENGGGTSASAPLFASMIALINDDRLKSGKPPLGFLNPWLYKKATQRAFTDITDGRSEGCKGRTYGGAPAPIIPQAGWDAVEGWDPVTGLGTPKFEKLRELGMKC
ncbi:hypothetical protein E4U48_001451 [Claviceps purpurea]|nr:hypothetical protein E4U48_001451 [Claviceps purpurea]